MIRVLFFLGTTNAGGAERVVCNLANSLVDENYCVEILQYYQGECHYNLDKKVSRKSIKDICKKKSIFQKMLAIRKYALNNVDVVISFMTVFNIIALASMIGSGMPIIISERNDPKYSPNSIIKRILRKVLYPFATKIVCQTNTAKNFFSKTIKEKCCVIYNPVDLGKKNGCALLKEKKKEIVSVGRLIPAKNYPLLLNAFKRFHESHGDYCLRVFGQGYMLDELRQQCEALKISECVCFEGVVKNVVDYISSSEIFVLTSNFEGMPNSLLEAMCIGLPVISTKVAGAVDLINESNGVLIDVNSEEQLFDALCKLADNLELRQEISKNAAKIFDILKLDTIVPLWRNLIDTTAK